MNRYQFNLSGASLLVCWLLMLPSQHSTAEDRSELGPTDPAGTEVEIPRITGEQILVDGVLDESVWQSAAIIKDFT
ncbi:MAG: hypothetical protein HKN13_03720, partial [Rhodothermales bacterium]|nr:hypothetical protein [Rhodothermales bacterium]